jgi:hypothetical protein
MMCGVVYDWCIKNFNESKNWRDENFYRHKEVNMKIVLPYEWSKKMVVVTIYPNDVLHTFHKRVWRAMGVDEK